MAADESGLAVRQATLDDLPALTETISLAFHNDPTWAWAFDDPSRRQEQYAIFWRFMIAEGLRYPWVLTTPAHEAVAVWIPPNGTELSAEAESSVGPLLERLVGGRAPLVLELFAQFDAVHPKDEPHFFLSVLGTHPDHAGRGIGMALLAESLGRVDRLRMPAYLESSNPVNNERYERHGFRAIGEFSLPGADVPVTAMWRDRP